MPGTKNAKRIGVAVVGCGYWGPNLIRNFFHSDAYEMLLACDAEPSRLHAVGGRFPSVSVTSNFTDILSNDAIDIVAICTPLETHYKLALAALKAQKHVLVEKPLCQTVEQATHLIAAAEAAGKVLMVDHTFIYTPAVQYIKALYEKGDLGRIHTIDSTRVNLGIFRPDTSVHWDLAPHDLSIVDFIMNKPPISVSAQGLKGVPGLDDVHESVCFLTVKYGAELVHLHMSWLSPMKIRRMVIVGSERMVLYDDTQENEKVKIYDWMSDDKAALEPEKALAQYRLGDVFVPYLNEREALASLVIHLADCIRGEALPITGGQEGLRVVEILEAVDRSLANGGRTEGLRAR